ncbi:hypothetical protein NMG60_11016600 [Bertholletia excelsa]
METEDFIDLSASSNSGCKSESGDLHKSDCEPSDANPEPVNSQAEEEKLNEMVGSSKVDIESGDSQPLLATEMDKDLIRGSSLLQVSVELSETTAVAEEVSCFDSRIETENGGLSILDKQPKKRDGSPLSNSISSVKKAKITVDAQQSSVNVMYNSLTRESKQKLEELLQHWSEWHAQHCASSYNSDKVLESGELTYFPALRVGLDSTSAVSFWMDDRPRSSESTPLDSNSVPLYDRGYSLCLSSTDGKSNLQEGMEIVDASRCFNCGSYSHSLKDCPKPRDNAAVNNARKQHKSRRNQNASSRNPTRYYQTSPRGKYDGLRPGVLDAETRQLLGVGELDPPPWLNRMREIGYPPGYLDVEDEDQPSGIVIFGEEENKEETEDGEILETECPDPPRKMSVEFPGINAPIPKNADEKRWAAGPSFDLSRNHRSHHRSNCSSEHTSRDHRYEHRFRDFRDDFPPGTEPGFGPSSSSSYRYNDYDSSYRGSPSYGRSISDRSRRSPLVHEGSLNHGSYGSVLRSPPNRLLPPENYRSGSSGRWDYDNGDDLNYNSSSYRMDHHRGWR